MVVTAVSGTTWTVTRAADGTSAATASNGAAVDLATGPPLYALYGATPTPSCTPPGLPTTAPWPWPNDSGATLSTYLTTYVYLPGGSRKLLTTDAVYQKIMRLYNWNYVIDNLGTTQCDWRLRFFGTDNNTLIFNSSGTLRTPGSSTYTINYNEILRWLTTTTDPFPSQMRAGRITYYGTIPTSITGSWPNFGNTDQRFWVEFINYVLGFWQTGANSYTDISNMVGYGNDFNWGSQSISSPPGAPSQYMTYTDNPQRPNLRYWFSPMLMADYLQNYNLWVNTSGYFMKSAGDGYEAPLYTAKQAYLAAVNTMENNHPNDWFTLINYSYPRTGTGGNDYNLGGNNVSGRFNCATCPLGTNYAYAQASLFFPLLTINSDGTTSTTNPTVTPFDADASTGNIPSANFVDTPRADGDTCFAMGLMLAYNQFAVTPSADKTLRTFVTSTPINFPTGMAGGLGRNGAQKVVIFETDGLANCSASTSGLVTDKTGGYTYYPIRYDMNRQSASEYPTTTTAALNDPTVLSQVYGLIDTLSSTYGTSRNPFKLYAIGFGPVFVSGAPDASGGLSTLQTMQVHGNTQNNASTALPTNQVITGTDSQMSANMISCYTNILQNGVQIALIK
jgi:hypothetical protein